MQTSVDFSLCGSHEFHLHAETVDELRGPLQQEVRRCDTSRWVG